MEYPPAVKRLLEDAGADVGDSVAVHTKDERFEGVVMPHHAFSGDDVLTLKLPNGYNIGIERPDIARVEVVTKHVPTKKAKPQPPTPAERPILAVLGTGGTIASYVDYRTGAVHPALTTEELLFSVPEVNELATVRARVLYSILSENMKVDYWKTLAEEVAKEFEGGAKAVAIPHGTDTLAWTSAALSFLLPSLPGPVVLVGAQRSSDRPSSDAAMNLLATARLAAVDLGEVVVLMHGETSDSFAWIHRGTKVRKMHASRRDAFRSLNETPLGRVLEDGQVELRSDVRRRQAKVEVDTRMEPAVALVYFHPGMTPDAFRGAVSGAKGVVLAGSGLGHASSELIPAIAHVVRGGVPVVMTTQCLQGRVNMNVYETGRDLIKAGVLSGEDMLPETATVKLMWALARSRDPGELARLLRTNVLGEINEQIGLEEFST